MPHQSILSIFLAIFIFVLISCNISTSRATRLLPPKPESPLLSNSEAPPPSHHEWFFPKLQWPMINFAKHKQSRTQPKPAKFPPWLQGPTKAEEPTPTAHHSPPKFEAPIPQPKIPSFHALKPIPKTKWPMPKLPPYPAVPKWQIPELIPRAKKPTPTKHQVPATPPLQEIPSLLSPELAPMPSFALAPTSSSVKPNHN